MNNEDLLNAIGEIDDKYIIDGQPQERKTKKVFWIKVGALAACLALVLVIGIPMLTNKSDDFDLALSSNNVNVNYIKDTPNISINADLVWLTEEEIFTEYDTSIFSGTIDEIRNIEIDYNGRKNYNAIAKITAKDVYRGDLSSGEIVTILLPCPIEVDGFSMEDTGVVSAMREGMTGIFMPIKYDENSYRQENGATLYLQDIADYGFLDGERYVFLDTDQGLVFNKHAFSSIASARTLEDIENYVINMID